MSKSVILDSDFFVRRCPNVCPFRKKLEEWERIKSAIGKLGKLSDIAVSTKFIYKKFHDVHITYFCKEKKHLKGLSQVN